MKLIAKTLSLDALYRGVLREASSLKSYALPAHPTQKPFFSIAKISPIDKPSFLKRRKAFKNQYRRASILRGLALEKGRSPK